MKKNYILSILFVLGMLFNLSASAQQLQAVDDQASFSVNISGPVVVGNVLSNDLIDGLPVNISQITIAPAQSAYLTMDATGAVTYSGFAPAGVYLLTYQICVQGQPNNCAAGVFYLTVVCPMIDAPHISEAIQPTCSNPDGHITVDNAPANAVLRYSFNGAVIMVATGTGTVTIPVPNTNTGIIDYDLFFEVGMCTSAHTTVHFEGLGGFYLGMNGTYVDFNNNSFTDVGDIISYQYTVANTSCDELTNIQVYAAQVPVNGGPLAALNVDATDDTTFTSNHIITQADITNGAVNQSSYATANITGGSTLTYQAFSHVTLDQNDGIMLVAFVDNNNNGIKDGSEVNFFYGNYNYILNNDGVAHHVSGNQNPILYESNPTNSYDFSYTVESAYAQYYSVSTTYSDVTVADGSGITTYYFPVTAIPYTDLKISMFYVQPPRPGFLYVNQLFYTNAGNQPIASGTVTFTKDSALTISNISQAGTVATPTGFTYNFTNLLPNETRYITVSMPVPTIPTVSLGQLVINTATASLPPNDVDPDNNSFTLTRAIVGSYDPNEKSENHGGKILVSEFDNSDYLTYTIWFENTGTADAINVRVNDVLDDQLDENSVRMVRASHAYQFDRVGNNLSWTFSAIDLVPSVPNTTIGHGFVTFQVKPKPGFALGDIIPNHANIYFDFNPAIVTNTWNTQFVNSLTTDQFAFSHFKYYPNPVKSTLTVSNDVMIDAVAISSVLGQQVILKKGNGMRSEINLSGIPNGIYFVKITSGKNQHTFKIIKE